MIGENNSWVNDNQRQENIFLEETKAKKSAVKKKKTKKLDLVYSNMCWFI